jgi:hypothetical protein
MSREILKAVREASISIATCLDEPNEVSKKDLEHLQNQITKIENYLTPFYLEELEEIKLEDNKSVKPKNNLDVAMLLTDAILNEFEKNGKLDVPLDEHKYSFDLQDVIQNQLEKIKGE